MSGQPEGEFDVTELIAVEPGDPAAEQGNIIDTAEPFQLRATFDGTGTDWGNMEGGGWAYSAWFYAHGLGPGMPTLFFGPAVIGNLGAGGPYTAVQLVPGGTLPAGTYKCTVVVGFRNPATGTPWLGWLGYNECVIMMFPWEE